ncbi:MAG: UDP-3-O-(3-hydroxymyristoyl)glucosamine N-acyltransferase [Alphaproteobacteria bacterium]|nr:UDP-3-O-(3-hydroxymyristoyl)glucosamine N-acyltransferase [Alphaproteobacteria bacterium]
MTKTLTMAEIAAAIGGRLKGDGSLTVSRLAHPSDIQGPQDLVLAMDKALLPLLQNSPVRSVIVAEGAEVPSCILASIEVGRSRVAMAKMTRLFEEKVIVPAGIHPTAVIEVGAKIEPNVTIGAYSYICAGAQICAGTIIHPQVYVGPKVKIGADGLIYSGVRVGSRVRIGARCIIHFNASIGADGFSFVTPEMGSVEQAKSTGEVGLSTNVELIRIASLGSVVIGDDVEIGANTSIDRGTIISTTIGNGTKIDNQVQIGHNVTVGENCMLCGRSGIAGSAVIGNRVVLGGAVGVADHVKIGDDVIVMGMSGVAGNVSAKSIIGGIPAKPRGKMIEDMRRLNRINRLVEKVEELTRRIDELEGKG